MKRIVLILLNVCIMCVAQKAPEPSAPLHVKVYCNSSKLPFQLDEKEKPINFRPFDDPYQKYSWIYDSQARPAHEKCYILIGYTNEDKTDIQKAAFKILSNPLFAPPAPLPPPAQLKPGQQPQLAQTAQQGQPVLLAQPQAGQPAPVVAAPQTGQPMSAIVTAAPQAGQPMPTPAAAVPQTLPPFPAIPQNIPGQPVPLAPQVGQPQPAVATAVPQIAQQSQPIPLAPQAGQPAPVVATPQTGQPMLVVAATAPQTMPSPTTVPQTIPGAQPPQIQKPAAPSAPIKQAKEGRPLLFELKIICANSPARQFTPQEIEQYLPGAKIYGNSFDLKNHKKCNFIGVKYKEDIPAPEMKEIMEQIYYALRGPEGIF